MSLVPNLKIGLESGLTKGANGKHQTHSNNKWCFYRYHIFLGLFGDIDSLLFLLPKFLKRFAEAFHFLAVFCPVAGTLCFQSFLVLLLGLLDQSNCTNRRGHRLVRNNLLSSVGGFAEVSPNSRSRLLSSDSSMAIRLSLATITRRSSGILPDSARR